MADREVYERITAAAEGLAPELSALRRTFHRYPELGWMEMRTTSVIAARLKEYGCDEVLVGRDVCRADARMGVPEEAVLDAHYALAEKQEGTELAWLPCTKGGFTGAVGILRCGPGPVAQMHGCTCSIRLMGAAGNGHNDAPLCERLERVCRGLALPVTRRPETVLGGSEDYSCMSERVQSRGGQSCYFLNLSACASTLHSERFDFREEALVNGVKVFCGAAADLLA